MNDKELYQEYLKSPRWKELRKQALQAAGNKCQVCNSSKRLNVHHRQYPEVWGTEPQNFLTVLCRKCHKLFHESKGLVKKQKHNKIKHVKRKKRNKKSKNKTNWSN